MKLKQAAQVGKRPRLKGRVTKMKSQGDDISMKRILSYSVFDTMHFGHIRWLQHVCALGDHLIASLSTGEFNSQKDKKAFHQWDGLCGVSISPTTIINDAMDPEAL